MPRFSELGLLFVHIPKNAGRSIEQALLCGTGSPDGGRRSLLNRAATALQRVTASRFAEEKLIGTIDRSFAAQHLTFSEMELLGLFGSETPFAVVRNPFDRAVSSVLHFSPAAASVRTDRTEFERLLAAWLDRPVTNHNDRAHRRPQSDFVIDMHGHRAVEHVLRFESLDTDFRGLTGQMGLTGIDLGWRGRSNRLRDYRDYFTPEARRLVEREYASDLETFDYSF